MSPRVLAVLLLLAATLPGARAGDRASWPPAIEDNSFLIEEAYNQEPGVVQWIGTGTWSRPDRRWGFSFTNEWPVPDETNQLSFTANWFGAAAGQRAGVGDVLLNYRRQVLSEDADGIAFAPRLSAILATGDWREGRGRGGGGVQVSLPFSRRFARSFAAHANLGATWTRGARYVRADGADARIDLFGLNEGVSLIWLASPSFNVLAEFVAFQDHEPDGAGGRVRADQEILDLGVRFAANFPKGQLVWGAAVLHGFGDGAPDRGAFLYLSWEAPVWKPRARSAP